MHFCLCYASLKTSNAKWFGVFPLNFSDSFQAIGVQSYEIRQIDQFISMNLFKNQRFQCWIDWRPKIITSNSCFTQIRQQIHKRKYQKHWKYNTSEQFVHTEKREKKTGQQHEQQSGCLLAHSHYPPLNLHLDAISTIIICVNISYSWARSIIHLKNIWTSKWFFPSVDFIFFFVLLNLPKIITKSRRQIYKSFSPFNFVLWF